MSPNPLCKVYLSDYSKTIENIEIIFSEDYCPHICKSIPKANGVEVYFIADLCCQKTIPKKNEPCGKPDSDIIHIIAKKDFKSRSAKPQYVTFKALSLKSSLLEFPDGYIVDNTSIYEEDSNPLVITNVYTKGNVKNCDSDFIKIKKSAKDFLLYAPIMVNVFIWNKKVGQGTSKKQQGNIEVAILPITNQKKDDDSKPHIKDQFTKGCNHMDPALVAAISSWLWPALIKGGEIIKGGVEKALGNTVEDLVGKILKKTYDMNPEKALDVEKNPSENIELAKRLVTEASSIMPEESDKLLREIKDALKRLLKNDLYFSDEDIRQTLVPSLGYPDGAFGSQISTKTLVNKFIDQAIADNKLQQLIEEIQNTKEHLFKAY